MITQKQYLQRKIDTSRFYDSDAFYLSLAETLCKAWPAENTSVLGAIPVVMQQEVVLNLIGYLMDVVSDLGLWRAFTSHSKTLYGKPVPFYEIDDYIDFELNKADVRFMTWYSICFLGDPGDNPLYPLDAEVVKLADTFFEIMESQYDDAPRPEGMIKTSDLEMHDPEDAEDIQTLGHWVFWSSYLMVPCFKSNMAMIYSKANPDDRRSLVELMGQAQMELPTGPLALYLREWIWLIIEGKLPPTPRHAPKPEKHPYYVPFMEVNEGNRIAFFNNYKNLNQFLGKALGWDADADNLPQLRDAHDFTLLTNELKGLLIGRNVARCFAAPNNAYYDKSFAEQHDFYLLSKRGYCPIDLTEYALREGFLPDLNWVGIGDSSTLTQENADFIARCFLLQYYRAV